MSAKLKAALDLRAAGFSAGQIAAELEVNTRTVRKWWAKARALAGADAPPPEIEEIDPNDPAALGEAMRRLVARETGAALALSQRDPGAATAALARLARAMKHIPSAADHQRDDELSLDELRAKLMKTIDGLRDDDADETASSV